jgi:protein-tyrosine phosphatase
VPNTRDLGGYPTRDGGRVRTGLVYRSGGLNRLTDGDAERLVALGIRTVFDLRTEPERTQAPDRIPPGASYVSADVLGEEGLNNLGNVWEMFTDPLVAQVRLAEGRGAAMWTGQYRDFVRLGSARAAYGRLFASLAGAANRPVLFHCSTGKDRTGWAAAALLTLLHVPDEIVMEDFLLSSILLGPAVAPMLDGFASRGGDPALLSPIVEVLPGYLEASLAEVERLFGTIEGYFADGLGIDAETQRDLREALVEGP